MRVIAAVLALMLLSPPAQGGDEGANERRALGLIETFTAGDGTAASSYLEQHLAPDLRARRDESGWNMIAEMLANDLSGGELIGVAIEDDGSLRAKVRTDRGVARFDFTFDDAGRISGFSVAMDPGGHGEEGRPPLPGPGLRKGMTREQIVDALTGFFEKLSVDNRFSGTALIAVDGEPVFRVAHGLASRRFGVPNTMATRFNIGSINKDFTKIAIARLCADGKLRLDDSIGTHLPDYPDAGVASTVTIDQLVHHRSGIPDIFNEDFFAASKAQFRAPRDYFKLFTGKPLRFDPGTSMRYSNANYMILGAIVESITGTTYDDWVVENVFGPAGMQDCGFFAIDEPVPNVAIGYTRRSPYGNGELRNNVLMLPAKGSPAGSAYCTAMDLLQFDNALRTHRLTSPAWTRWIFGGDAPEPGTPGEGSSERLDVAAGLAGGAPGVSAVLEIDGEIVLVLLSNLDEPSTEEIARTLMPELTETLR